MSIKRSIIISLLLIATISVPIGGVCQEVEIAPIKESHPRTWITELSVYGMGGSAKNANLWTASNGVLGMTDYDLYHTFCDFGLTTSLYCNNIFKYNASLGYMYSRYAINRGIHLNGYQTNWISLDLSASYHIGYGLFYNAGLKNNFYVHGSKSPTGNFDYVGLSNDCYNKYSCCWYVGATFCYKFIKLNLKFGNYFIPLLNANKIANNNLGKTHVAGMFFEVGMAVTIFSTSSKFSSLVE